MRFIINTIQLICLYLFAIIFIFGIMIFMPSKVVFIIAISIFSRFMIWISGGKLIIEGKENLNKDKSYIFMSNHASWLDIPCIFRATKRNLRFIGKIELKKNIFLRLLMNKLRIVFIDRSSSAKSTSSMKKVIKEIQSGADICIFPEGTRTKDGKLSAFKRGGFKMAIDSGIEIVPIGITNSGKVWPRNNFSFRPGTITVKIGKPIASKSFNRQSTNVLSNSVKAEIEKLIIK